VIVIYSTITDYFTLHYITGTSWPMHYSSIKPNCR